MKKRIVLAVIGCAAVAAVCTGCGGNKKAETEIVVETAVETAAETESETETKTTEVTATPTSMSTPVPSTPTATPTKTPEEYEATEYIANDNVNVRSTPSTDSDIVASYAIGDTVNVNGETENDGLAWYSVTVQYTDDEGQLWNVAGYVSKQYVSESHKLSGSVVDTDTEVNTTANADNTDTGDEISVEEANGSPQGIYTDEQVKEVAEAQADAETK